MVQFRCVLRVIFGSVDSRVEEGILSNPGPSKVAVLVVITSYSLQLYLAKQLCLVNLLHGSRIHSSQFIGATPEFTPDSWQTRLSEKTHLGITEALLFPSQTVLSSSSPHPSYYQSSFWGPRRAIWTHEHHRRSGLTCHEARNTVCCTIVQTSSRR
jgi:hypothetical protein